MIGLGDWFRYGADVWMVNTEQRLAVAGGRGDNDSNLLSRLCLRRKSVMAANAAKVVVVVDAVVVSMLPAPLSA